MLSNGTNLFSMLGNEAFVTHLTSLLCIEAGVVQKHSNGLAICGFIHTLLVMANGNNSGSTGPEGYVRGEGGDVR